ncbi:prolipoprotein diacylglyceryl transferase [gamma proteobacterium HTCC5015]|nr:prolipoprotein diacylglyceryl transferase [gamma proteobacterium HTCC5015]
MLHYPEIDPVALSIGSLSIHWYGVMYLLGFAGFWWMGTRRARRSDTPLNAEQVGDFLFYGALGVILGGRIGYMLFYGWDVLADNPLNILRVWDGGMAFHGGLLGVIAAMWWYAKRLGIRFFQLADFVAPMVPIGLLTGRIGNFINGELWGAPAPDFPLAMVYEGVARHPSMLYEALLEGLLLLIVLMVYSRKPRPLMTVSGLFLLGYGAARFAVEFVRLPDAHIGYLAGGWFTMGQLLTLPMLAYGAWLFVRGWQRREVIS